MTHEGMVLGRGGEGVFLGNDSGVVHRFGSRGRFSGEDGKLSPPQVGF